MELNQLGDAFFSGGIAGSTGILLTQPLDTVRIRLQTDAGAVRYGGSLTRCIQSTLRSEGVAGLFKGVASPMMTAGVMNAVLFAAYETALSQLLPNACTNSGAHDGPQARQRQDHQQAPPLLACCAAGGAAGIASAFITAPTELVKCRAQVDVHSAGRLADERAIATSLLRSGGFGGKGVFRGLSATILRDSVSFCCYFGVYEAVVRALTAARPTGGANDAANSFWAGGCAGPSGRRRSARPIAGRGRRSPRG